MKKYLTTLLAACCMLAAFSMPASALEYHFDGPDAGLFGRPTSDDTIYVTMDKPVNTDRSKKAAAEILRRLCPKRERPVYFVTRSSHLTMASMANIEMAQTMTKMLHVAEIEMRL